MTVNLIFIFHVADKTRVKLKKIGDITGSDYINANFVDVSAIPSQFSISSSIWSSRKWLYFLIPNDTKAVV